MESNAAWVSALALSAVALCVGMGVHLAEVQARSDRAELRAEAHQRVELLRDEAVRSLEVLRSVATFLRVRDGVPTRAEFRDFVGGPLSRMSELQALEWIPRVAADERDAYEAQARADGLTNFRFTELDTHGAPQHAAARPLYFPVFYCEPEALNTRALGLDLFADEARRSALEHAARNGRPTASAPVRLAQEHEHHALGFLVLQAVGREPSLRGFALAVFRVADLLKPVLAGLARQELGLSVTDVLSGTQLVGDVAPASDSQRSHSETLTLGERPFRLTVSRLAVRPVWLAHPAVALYPLAGVLLVALIATYVLRRENARLEQRVGERTAALAQANEHLSAEVEVRKQAELEAAAARAEQARFLAVMSHEIRTPLNAMIGYAQLLTPHLAPSDEFSREALVTIAQSGRHLLGLVDEVLDLSKIEAGKLSLVTTDFDLATVLEGLAAVFKPKCLERSLTLHVEAPGDLHWLRGDEDKLRQVLSNLLGNAIKFTDRGGVWLRVERASGADLRFAVRDSGRGIAPAEQARVFGDFYQSAAPSPASGVGLGLAIARRLVSLMGGSLTLSSTPDAGSTFSFTLPFAAPLPLGARGAFAAPVPRLASDCACSALVVDDSAESRRVMTLLLQTLGLVVESVADGEQALARCAERSYDVLFLDLLLPGIDGVETARRLRDQALSVSPVIAVSASALDPQRTRCLAEAFAAFVAKPVRLERLVEVLTALPFVRFDASASARPPAEPLAPLSDEERTLTPLLRQIAAFAAQYRVTRLREAFVELARAGPRGPALYARFEPLLSRYDMSGIERLVLALAPEDGKGRDEGPRPGAPPC